jgi:hypothetical protein
VVITLFYHTSHKHTTRTQEGELRPAFKVDEGTWARVGQKWSAARRLLHEYNTLLLTTHARTQHTHTCARTHRDETKKVYAERREEQVLLVYAVCVVYMWIASYSSLSLMCACTNTTLIQHITTLPTHKQHASYTELTRTRTSTSGEAHGYMEISGGP